MREIKFRAWDGKNMVNGQLYSIAMNGRLIFDSGECGDKVLNYPVMQFTGLLDRNGKEIYEGDIDGQDNELMYVVYDDKSASFGLKYCNPCSSIIDYVETAIDWESLNIIGNIYEHK